MNYGVVGGSFSGRYTFDEFLKVIKEVGFDYFEIPDSVNAFRGTLDLHRDNLNEIKKKVASYGLEIRVVGGSNDFIQADKKKLEEQIQGVKRCCDLAAALGASTVRVFGGEPKEDIPQNRYVDMIVDGFKACVGYAENKGVKLGLENHGRITNNADVEIKILEKVGCDYLGVTVDTSNFRWYGHDLDTVRRYLKILAPYTVHTHLKDGSAEKGFQRDYTALALGEGEIDLAMFIEELEKSNYNGPLCIEYEGKEDPRAGYEKGLKFLQFFERVKKNR